MIRPFTVLCLLTACGSGLYLYSEKHRTELLDREIGHVIHATEAARARTGLLRAEWAVANEPGRLQDMASRYLALHTMAPTQFVQVAELSTHLPAPMANPPESSTDDDEAPPVATAPLTITASAAPPTDPVAAAKHPAPVGRPDGKSVQKLLASATPRSHAQHRTLLADRVDSGMLAHGTPLPLAAPQPMGARVYSAMARPMRMSASAPSIISALPSYAPAQTTVHSALGGSMALPPPVPYGR